MNENQGQNPELDSPCSEEEVHMKGTSELAPTRSRHCLSFPHEPSDNRGGFLRLRVWVEELIQSKDMENPEKSLNSRCRCK